LQTFKDFLNSGDQGYYAYVNNKCVHRSWIQFGEKEISLHPFFKKKIKADEAYIHYSETAPGHRGQNVYGFVLSQIVKEFKDRYRKIYISTNVRNIGSQRGITKAGFVAIEMLTILVIFGIKIRKVKKLGKFSPTSDS